MFDRNRAAAWSGRLRRIGSCLREWLRWLAALPVTVLGRQPLQRRWEAALPPIEAVLAWPLEILPPWLRFPGATDRGQGTIPARSNGFQIAIAVGALSVVSLLVGNVTGALEPRTAQMAAAAPQNGHATASATDSTSAGGPEYGIDVSNFNGSVDWHKVASDGKRFAFVLASDGDTTPNSFFREQFSGAKAAGLLVGAYHFARPNGPAADQAGLLLRAANYSRRNDGRTLPPVLDLEDDPSGGGCYGRSPSELRDWVQTFRRTIKAATGQDAIIYSNSSFWQNCMADTDAFTRTNPLWIASYSPGQPHAPGKWAQNTFWQNTSSGRVNGIDGDVDLNVFNGTIDQLRKFTHH